MTIERDAADVVIIGAGVVGCALARRLARSDLSVLVLEATGDVGDVTSKANTAILHTGFDTVPGSLESTLVAQGAHALRRYRDRLFLTSAVLPRVDSECEWPVASAAVCELGPGLGSMRWVPQRGGLDASRLPPTLVVRRRGEGETLKPRRRGRSQSVQHLCQALGVLPWMRDALPHVYAGEHLVAVGDLWRDTRWCVAAPECGLGVEWRDAPVVT